MAATRTDLAIGVALLGCSYGATWVLRQRPKTRVERLAVDTKRAGNATRLAAVGVFRLALQEAMRRA